MATRRIFILSLAACAVTAPLGAYRVSAATQPTVEIIALPHYPVQNALKAAHDFLATLGASVKVVEIDPESAPGEKRIKAVGLKGHVPILLLVNGSYRFKRADGTVVEFKDFPAAVGNPLGLNGSWTIADFESAVKAALGKPEK